MRLPFRSDTLDDIVWVERGTVIVHQPLFRVGTLVSFYVLPGGEVAYHYHPDEMISSALAEEIS